MTLKRCTICGLSLPLTDYNMEMSSEDEHASRCRSCANEAGRAYYWKTHPVFKTCDPRVLPAVSKKGRLKDILPYLIQVSKAGVNKDSILSDSIVKIKEALE